MCSLNPKLLIVYPNQFGYHTDSYNYSIYLRDKFDVTYICFDQGFDKADVDRVHVIYLPYNDGKIKRLARFFLEAINFTKQNATDIAFIVQFKFCFFLGIFLKCKIKILDYRTGDLSPNPILRRIKNCLMKFDSFFFQHITVISEGLRMILKLNKNHTLILPLGGEIISTQSRHFEHLDLLYVGSLNGRKIYETIEGIGLFLTRHKDFSSVLSYSIIGRGSPLEEKKILETIELWKLSSVVQFIGQKRFGDLKPYFDSNNIGVSYLPKTPYYEHQPVTKTFEYANSGLFTIATSTFENCKVINHANGILCDDTPESFSFALEELVYHRNAIREDEIRSSLKDFLWETIVIETLQPYFEQLLEG
jgi:glycosyltransferase involved in cell wall biosynthesis